VFLAVVAAALATLVGVVASAAMAAFPGRDGKVVFQTNRDGNAEIYTMDADGTSRVNLTRHLSEDVTPHWSADGHRIVFASNRDGNFEIFTMKDDGTGLTQLTFTSVNNRWPSWTGEGRILFQRGSFPTATSTG
jgi:TolB protein